MTVQTVTDTARIKGCEYPLPRPLTAADIPEQSQLVSPREGKHHGFAPPHYPGSPEFDAQLKEVTDVRDQVCRGLWPTGFLTTDNPSGLGGRPPTLIADALGFQDNGHPDNPRIAAMSVSMDRPLDLGIELYSALSQLESADAKYIDFVSGFNRFSVELAVKVHAALETVFDVKYFYMLERPETVLGVAGTVFCEDEIGAPGHPAYGAGHAAAAAASAKVITEWFPQDKYRNNILDAAWQFGMWRTLLGVHYRQDNAIGWDIGWSV
jgi:hypothetical protein